MTFWDLAMDMNALPGTENYKLSKDIGEWLYANMSSGLSSPRITVHLTLTDPTLYLCEPPEAPVPRLTTHFSLSAAAPITIDIGGHFGFGHSSLILDLECFLQFSFHDIVTGEVVDCAEDAECGDPGGTLSDYDLVTLEPGK